MNSLGFLSFDFLLVFLSFDKDVLAFTSFNGVRFGSEEAETSAEISMIENRKRYSDVGFPPDLLIRLSSVAVNRDIPLKRNLDLSDNVPIFLQRFGTIKGYRIQSDKDVAYYDDMSTGASFMVWGANGTQETPFTYFGTFVADGNLFRVKPKTRGYSLTKVKDILPQHTDFISVAENELTSTSSKTMKTGSKKHKRQTLNYQIEAFFVIDYAVYQFWFQQTTEDITDKETATLNRIRQYYAFVLNGVNLSYRSVRGRGYTITCIFAGLYIADTAGAAPFVNDNLYNGTGGILLDANKALDAFRKWAKISLTFQFDHAFLFSGYNLTRMIDTEEQDIGGLAYRPGLCTYSKYSINEDQGLDPYIVKVAAHELGHNLGAHHDGDTNLCSFADNYIMGAPSPAGDRLYRRWIFSNCSLDDFDTYIQTMESGEYNCMTTLAADYTGTDLLPYANDLPGQIYPPDKQCEYKFGHGAFFSRGHYESGNYSAICTKMVCGTANGLYWQAVAWDGTTCGNQKICEAGYCVFSASAPTIETEQCMFGDTPYNVSNRNQTCSEYLGATSDAYLCYSYRKYCCVTCQRHHELFGAVQGCEYGDRSPSCATMSLFGCSLPPNAEICCLKCSDRTTASTSAMQTSAATSRDPALSVQTTTMVRHSTTVVNNTLLSDVPSTTTVRHATTSANKTLSSGTTRAYASTSTMQTSTATSRDPAKSIQSTTTVRHITAVVNNTGLSGVPPTTTLSHTTTAANEAAPSGTTRMYDDGRFHLIIVTVVLFLLCI